MPPRVHTASGDEMATKAIYAGHHLKAGMEATPLGMFLVSTLGIKATHEVASAS